MLCSSSASPPHRSVAARTFDVLFRDSHRRVSYPRWFNTDVQKVMLRVIGGPTTVLREFPVALVREDAPILYPQVARSTFLGLEYAVPRDAADSPGLQNRCSTSATPTIPLDTHGDCCGVYTDHRVWLPGVRTRRTSP